MKNQIDNENQDEINKILSKNANPLETVANNFAKVGLKPQFKQKMPDGSLVDTDESQLLRLKLKSQIATTAQMIAGASQEEKTIWAIEMKDYANELYRNRIYDVAMEKYLECLTASNFNSSTDKESNIDQLILPVLCNLAACCIQQKVWSKAASFCVEAIKLRESCQKALYRLTVALIQLGEFEVCLEKLEVLQEYCYADPTFVDLLSINENERKKIIILKNQAFEGMKRQQKSYERHKKAMVKAFQHKKTTIKPIISNNSIEFNKMNDKTIESKIEPKLSQIEFFLFMFYKWIKYFINYFQFKSKKL